MHPKDAQRSRVARSPLREKASLRPVLRPPGGPTQVRTTLRLAFRAAIKADGELEMGVGDLEVPMR
jgi:hypothetical protein